MKHLLFAALLVAAPATAGITIDFEAIPNGDRPANYYNGGSTVSDGVGLFGPNLGVVFADANRVFQRFDLCPGGGCSGVFPGGSSGARALTNFGQLSTSPAITTVNIAAGFVGLASVYHYGGESSMQIYRDVGGQAGNGGFGVLLGFITMPQTLGCTLAPNLAVLGCSFSKYTINFNGTAQSIVLAGGGSYFDDLTIGAVGNPGGVPESASWAMLIAGFGLERFIDFVQRSIWRRRTPRLWLHRR